MSDYDFRKIFEPMEFQDFARDMIQVRENIFLESFAEGRDKGIDGRYVREDGYTIIMQAKRKKGSISQYVSEAKKEKAKLDKLPRVDRYILVISEELFEEDKTKLMEVLLPYVLENRDIVTGKDLNNWLSSGEEEYARVEEKYFKLLIQNTKVLKHVLFQTVNGALVELSKEKWEQALEKAKIFVETNIYTEALKRILRNHVLIISGVPGVGKTTLAEQLALYFCVKKGFNSYFWVNSVDDLYVVRGISGKKVIVFDDFWGSNGFDGFGNGRKTRELLTFIESIQKKNDTVLLMTTREYILEQGLKENEDLRRYVKQNKIDFQMEEYNETDRLRIFFGHLRNSSLTWKQLNAFADVGMRVIWSKNYNPRVIADYIKTVTPEMEAEACAEEFLKYVDCPNDFWSRIYHELSLEAKTVFLILAILPHPVAIEVVKECFEKIWAENNGMMEIKEFYKVIFELEKTVIRTDSYNRDLAEWKVVTFQNPSARDFILDYIRKNLNQCHPLLYKSCLYFEQAVEYLDILFQMDYCGDLYEKVMEKAFQLSDRPSIDFYKNHGRFLARNGEIDRFLDSYYRVTDGSNGSIGRAIQLLLRYRENNNDPLQGKIYGLYQWVLKKIRREPESLQQEDLGLFPEMAVRAVKEGLEENKEGLIKLYAVTLMRCRLRLEGRKFAFAWKEEWERYINLHKSQVESYLRKYYRGELCMAAVKEDDFAFADLLDDWQYDLDKYGIEPSKEDKRYMRKYENWLQEEPFEKATETGVEEETVHNTVSVQQVLEDFQAGYMEEILPEEIENPKEWIMASASSPEIKDILLKNSDNYFWHCFLKEDTAFEFLQKLATKKKYLADDILESMREVFSYISETSQLEDEILFELFLRLDLNGHKEKIWSRAELKLTYPEFWEWEEEAVKRLVEAGVFVKYQQMYRLVNEKILLCVYIEQLRRFSDEDRRICYRAISRSGQKKVEECGRLALFIRAVLFWREYLEGEGFLWRTLEKLDSEDFKREILQPAVNEVYEELYDGSMEQVISNLIAYVQLELYINRAGEIIGFIYRMDEYLEILEAIDDDSLLDIVPSKFNKVQRRILSEHGLIEGESSMILLEDLSELGLLRELGIYEKLESIWKTICKRKENVEV